MNVSHSSQARKKDKTWWCEVVPNCIADCLRAATVVSMSMGGSFSGEREALHIPTDATHIRGSDGIKLDT